MIFIVPESIKENEEYENDSVANDIKLSYRNFQDILTSIKSKLDLYTKNIDISSLNLTKDYNLINSNNLFSNLSKLDKKIEITNTPVINVIKKEESHFSKSNAKVFNKNEKEKMEFGTKVHYYLETLDLHNPDLSDIESHYKEKVEAFLNSDLLNNISKAKVYQEYEFMEEDVDEEKHGVIDLMLEYTDHIDIIDYKLKNIDDEAYSKQLNGYKNYIEKLSKKPVNIYLYSIMDERYQKL